MVGAAFGHVIVSIPGTARLCETLWMGEARQGVQRDLAKRFYFTSSSVSLLSWAPSSLFSSAVLAPFIYFELFGRSLFYRSSDFAILLP